MIQLYLTKILVKCEKYLFSFLLNVKNLQNYNLKKIFYFLQEEFKNNMQILF